MTDDVLRRSLEDVELPRRPDPIFAGALLDDLRQELGFPAAAAGRGGPVELVRGIDVRRRLGVGKVRRRWVELLVVAAVIAAVSMGLVAVAGSLPQRVAPPTSMLTQIRDAGRIRIAIRPDHPQSTLGGQTAAGFDADVARELARRLGVSVELVIEDANAIVAPGAGGAWDVALPSRPDWTIDGTAFLSTAPYYYWPHRLVVSSTSTATGVADVSAGPICAVAGDGGESWLRGDYGGVASAPLTSAIMTQATDADCLAALASGAAIAAITAHLSDADLQVRADIRAIGGPAPEPRTAIVRRQQETGPDPSDLLHAIGDALVAMRVDGTLARLSESRFGGADLSTP